MTVPKYQKLYTVDLAIDGRTDEMSLCNFAIKNNLGGMLGDKCLL
jgi:hypothetical protein